MNTLALTQYIADYLTAHLSPEVLSRYTILTEVEPPRGKNVDSIELVVTSSQEAIAGNYTYRVTMEARLVADPAPQGDLLDPDMPEHIRAHVDDVTRTLAPLSVMKYTEVPAAPAVIITMNPSPATVAADDTAYAASWTLEMVVQF